MDAITANQDCEGAHPMTKPGGRCITNSILFLPREKGSRGLNSLEADLSRKRLERKSQKEVQNRTGVGNVSIVREENGILNIESCSRKLSGWKQWPRTMAGMFHINMLTYELNKASCR